MITAIIGGRGHTLREFPVGKSTGITVGINVRSFVLEAKALYVSLVVFVVGFIDASLRLIQLVGSENLFVRIHICLPSHKGRGSESITFSLAINKSLSSVILNSL
jgi:hypothetical protein